MTLRQKRVRGRKVSPASAPTPRAHIPHIISEIKEDQRQDRALRLTEFSESKPLTEEQLNVLRPNAEHLKAMLGLQLLPHLDGSITIKASQYVGTARFTYDGRQVTVQVQPKIGQADVFRMLDYSTQPFHDHEQAAPLYEGDNVTLLFLSYFAREVSEFLRKTPDRHYAFETINDPGRVKGRPLLEAYIRQSLPYARPHVLPCVYLNYHIDTFENQVIAAAVNLALRLTREIAGNGSHALAHQLSTCARQLHGVSIQRINTQSIRRFRYNRNNRHYQHIHKLCMMILDNRSVSLQAGKRIPFFSFSVDMSKLFESYVAAAFSRAFMGTFSADKLSLTHNLEQLDKKIILDGILKKDDMVSVVECKYKETTFNGLFSQKLLNEDIFQTVAYTVYEKIQADRAILVYPVADRSKTAVVKGASLTNFGWRPDSQSPIPIQVLGINLTASFHDVSQELKKQISQLSNP